MQEKSIILFKCKKKLNAKLQQKVVDDTQKVYSLNNEVELKNFLKEKNFCVILYDKQENRKSFLEMTKNLKNINPNFYTVLILSNNEMKKITFSKNQIPDVVYISNPPRMEELSQFLNFIFEIEKLKTEINEREEIIKAFESASELSRQELMNAYQSLQAQQIASELSRKELLETKKNLSAWEQVIELARKERLSMSEEITALEKVLELSRQERMMADKIISAWEQTLELSRAELMETYNKLKKILEEKNQLIEELLSKFPKPSK